MKTKTEAKKVPAREYFILVEEWEYPNSMGRKAFGTYANRDETMALAQKFADIETCKFASLTGCDPFMGGKFGDGNGCAGFCLTDRKGLEGWWYCAKVVPVPEGIL